MGFYADMRLEFAKCFGFFPSRESGLLDLYIEDINLCISKIKDDFLKNKINKKYIEMLSKKYYKEFKEHLNIEEDIFEYHLYLNSSKYVFNKAFDSYMKIVAEYKLHPFSEIKLIEDESLILNGKCECEVYNHLTCEYYKKYLDYREVKVNNKVIKYVIKNPFLDYRDKDFVMEIHKNIDYIEKACNSLKTGIYENGIETVIFDIKNNELKHLKNLFIDIVRWGNIKKIFLPIESNGIVLNKISDFCFSGLNHDIYIHIPNNYNVFDKYAFNEYSLDSYERDKFKYNLELENIHTLNLETLQQFENTNIEKTLKKEFENKYGFSIEGNALVFYLENRNNFSKILKDIVDYLFTGKNEINKIDKFKSILFNGKYFSNEVKGIIDKYKIIEVVYVNPYNSQILSLEGERFPNIVKTLIIPNTYTIYKDYTIMNMLKENKDLKIQIINPYVNIESKITGLVGTEYYDEYMKEYLKTHTLNEWKIFVAPSKIREEVFKNPNTNRVVTIDSHKISSDGVSKIWWEDEDEYYTWNEKELYWEYYYNRDWGSG